VSDTVRLCNPSLASVGYKAPYKCTVVILAGILWDADTNPEGFIGDEGWIPPGDESVMGLGPSGPLSRKSDFFRLTWRLLVNFERYF